MRVRDRRRGAPGAVSRQAVASKRAAVTLTAVLLLLAVAGVAGSSRLSGTAVQADRAVRLADSFQDLRYAAVRQSAALSAYQLVPTAEGRRQLDAASSDVDTALVDTLALSESRNRPAAAPFRRVSEPAQLAVVSEHQSRFQQLAAQVVDRIDRGDRQGAELLDEEQIAGLDHSIQDDLTQLEETRFQTASGRLRQLRRDGHTARVGTPVVLVVCLLLLAALSRVVRGYRQTVERQALHDALTGLPNRLLFTRRAEQVLGSAGRTRARPAVLLLDLDRFKQVNDTLGHSYGDDLLVEVGRRVSARLSSRDVVSRFGGDEFAVLLADADDGGQQFASELCVALQQPFLIQGVTVDVEASIGIATPGPGAQRVPDLLRRADVAMYAAKSARSGTTTYRADLDTDSTEHLQLLGELRRALESEQIVLHYQPKVDARTGEVQGVEALARWQHPSRGLLGPDQFIDLAESTTLIHGLTLTVLRQAIRLVADYLAVGRRLPVAVNISTRSLLEPQFPRTVQRLLSEAGVPTELLCLEITESTIMIDPGRSLATLQQLRDLGVRLSIDDFGTGYSSMAYLKVLPVHELKIDRSFVSDMTEDASNTVLVQSAVDLGHNLGLIVVAEGVEDAATLTALQAAGADSIQGYHLGRPMASADLRVWLSRSLPGIPAQDRSSTTNASPAAAGV